MARIKDPGEQAKKRRASKDLGPTTRAHNRYRLADGTAVPGVTTVTGQLAKPFLVGWANRLGLEGIDTTKYVDEAAKIGNAAHYLIQCKLADIEPDTSDLTLNQLQRAGFGVKAFDDWASEHTFKPAKFRGEGGGPFLEKILISEEFRYGGQIDAYGDLDDLPTLLDFKTTSGLYPEHGYQIGGGYWKLLRENGYPVKGVRILRIGRTEEEGWEEHVMTYTQVQKAWNVFKIMLDLYYARKDEKK